MATYSFLDVHAAITGPGGSFSIGGPETGVADEGISIEFAENVNTMVTGASGDGQHNLHASQAGTVIVRLLKTSPVNAQLSDLYNFQRASAANHGQNTIVVRDAVRGDTTTCRQCAFQRHTNIAYGKDGAMNEWRFDAIKIDPKLGNGQPSAL